MPQLMDHVAYLSQEIGPRPAGTEEEQQAALYITEQLQKDAGLSAVIEDFNSPSNADTVPLICFAVTLIATIASMFLSVLVIPAIVLSLISAVIFVLEVLGIPVLSRTFARGVSQNVVAKYEPVFSSESGSRHRKVILISRYDSGKVRPELKGIFLSALPVLQRATCIAIILVPILLAIKAVFFLHDTGTASMVLMVLTIIALVVVGISAIIAIIHMVSSYNEAANSNAAGTAVLLEVARRIGRRATRSAKGARFPAGEEAVIHGEQAALESGFVPEGAQIVYEAAEVRPPQSFDQSPESRLAAAKAAVAAMTGRPVAGAGEPQDIAAHLVQVKEPRIGEPTESEIRDQRDQTREAFAGASIVPQGEDQGSAPGQMAGASIASMPADPQAMALEGEGATQLAAEAVPGVEEQPLADEDQVDDGDDQVPAWFKKGQESAKRPKGRTPQVQRSRYADALDSAMSESSNYFSRANQRVNAETEERIRAMQDGIMEIPAPQRMQLDRNGNPIGETRQAPSQYADGIQPAYADDASAQYAQQQMPQIAPHQEGGSTVSMPPIDVSDLMQPQAEGAANTQQDAPQGERPCEAKRTIALPSISASMDRVVPLAEAHRQRAPLAEAEGGTSQTVAKNLLNMLPSIDAEEIAAGKGDAAPANAGGARKGTAKPSLSQLPSMSGVIRESKQAAQQSQQGLDGQVAAAEALTGSDQAVPRHASPSQSGPIGSVSKTGSFVSAGATGAFAPVGEELLENVHPDDIYVDDADDSAFDGSVTETGAFAGPGYVDMPKSRAQRLFGRFGFGKNKQEEASTPQEWLGVDEDFDARTIGKERGGWESFSQDDEDEAPRRKRSKRYSEESDFGIADDEWQGGAYRAEGGYREAPESGAAYDEMPEGGWGQESLGEYDAYGAPALPAQDYDHAADYEAIQQFRSADVTTEVWFVALGSELAGNSGMKAFLAEHDSELRGSIIINIEALGAGNLSIVESEGMYRTAKSSSRLKRFTKKASSATRIATSTTKLPWTDTAATLALRRGFQAMTIMGADGMKPAFFAQGDDIIDNIDEEALSGNADFIMELLKNI